MSNNKCHSQHVPLNNNGTYCRQLKVPRVPDEASEVYGSHTSSRMIWSQFVVVMKSLLHVIINKKCTLLAAAAHAQGTRICFLHSRNNGPLLRYLEIASALCFNSSLYLEPRPAPHDNFGCH